MPTRAVQPVKVKKGTTRVAAARTTAENDMQPRNRWQAANKWSILLSDNSRFQQVRTTSYTGNPIPKRIAPPRRVRIFPGTFMMRTGDSSTDDSRQEDRNEGDNTYHRQKPRLNINHCKAEHTELYKQPAAHRGSSDRAVRRIATPAISRKAVAIGPVWCSFYNRENVYQYLKCFRFAC